MSSKYPIYIFWGLMLPYPEDAEDDDDFYEKFDAFKGDDPKYGTTVILDGMGGEWLAVGHVIAKSDDYAQDLGNHSLPDMPNTLDAIRDPDRIKQFSDWRAGIQKTLVELGLEVQSLGLQYGWHVVQHHK